MLSKPTDGINSFNQNNLVKDANYIRKLLAYSPQDFEIYPNLNANKN